MKAVVWHGVGDVRLENVADPKIQEPTDAVVKLTRSAICGTDLHFVRGTVTEMVEGTILGHEGVGIVQEVGRDVRTLEPGDRVVVASTIACGSCVYCRAGYFSQCDRANPNGPSSGTAFFGGPKASGPFHGMQAEYVRVPFANVGLVKVPDEVSDDQAILLSDIFPTGWFGAVLAEIRDGDTVAVFGCGPVGQFAIASARLRNAGRVLAVDTIPDRLAMARAQGAETIDYEKEDPCEALRRLTGGIGPDRVIDAVGVDAEPPHRGPAARALPKEEKEAFAEELEKIAPDRQPKGEPFQAGRAPSIVLSWAVDAVAKAGTISVIGVYSGESRTFPVGKAMEKNLTVKMGNCNHRRYIPKLLDLVRMGRIDPEAVLTRREPLANVLEAYEAFDKRRPGWIKVELQPATDLEETLTPARR
jgi:threonine dehydrogenase-like Zn-dependent dehydrogenase